MRAEITSKLSIFTTQLQTLEEKQTEALVEWDKH